MARILSQYREKLEFESDAEYDWALSRIKDMRNQGLWAFDFLSDRSTKSLVLFTAGMELHGPAGPVKLAEFVQEYLSKLEKTFSFTMQWATFPSNFHDGGHGGGAVLVSKDSMAFRETAQAADEMSEKFEKGSLF